MYEEWFHATLCVAVRKCLKIYIFIKHYSWNQLYSLIGTHLQPANQLVKTFEWYFWMIQDSLMKFHMRAYLINLCLIDKNENYCISSFRVICPWHVINLFNGHITKKLKEQLYLFFPMTCVLIGRVHLRSFIKLSCMVQKILHFSLTDSQAGDMCQSSYIAVRNC